MCHTIRLRTLIPLLTPVFLLVFPAFLQATPPVAPPPAVAADDASSDIPFKQRLIDRLPPAVSEGLDVDLWGWLGDLENNQREHSRYWDVELGLAITKTFNQRITLSAQGNFIDSNKIARGELEQAYVSALLWEQSRTMLTVGKFNANFGIEARDFWDRTTGTTSLLFGAQPQDLIGFMVTQPLGDTGITLRPFMSADFQGAYYFDQSPSGGLMVEFQPVKELDFAVTNWVGPGFLPFGGEPLRSPFQGPSYDEPYESSVISNWQGPNFMAGRGSTLYFLEAKATWRPRPELGIGIEYLLGTTGTSEHRWGWWGAMVQADYDFDDHWHAFARWSFLDDAYWIVTGIFQRVHEVSGGVGYRFNEHLEARAEYRHDITNATDHRNIDSVSVHLSFAL